MSSPWVFGVQVEFNNAIDSFLKAQSPEDRMQRMHCNKHMPQRAEGDMTKFSYKALHVCSGLPYV